MSLLVFLDLSVAFDTIEHSILLLYLSRTGLWGHCFTVAPVLLGGENSSRKVVLGDSCLTCWPLTCGILLGSVLSLMLFSIYMEPVKEIIQRFGIWCHQYADNIQLYFSLPPKSEEAASSLDQCLISVIDWMRMNTLKFNPDETEVLLVSGKRDQGIGIQSVLDGITFPLKKKPHRCTFWGCS